MIFFATVPVYSFEAKTRVPGHSLEVKMHGSWTFIGDAENGDQTIGMIRDQSGKRDQKTNQRRT